MLVFCAPAQADSKLYFNPVSIEPGESKTLTLALNNDQPFIGFQADIYLPDGLEMVSSGEGEEEEAVWSMTSRADDTFMLFSARMSGGYWRITTFSTENSQFSGSSGDLINIDVKASSSFKGGTINLKNVRFTSVEAKNVTLDDSSVEVTSSASEESKNKLYISDFSISPGETKVVEMLLDNSDKFVAFNADFYLPSGLTLVDGSIAKTSRLSSGHKLSTKTIGRGTRVVVFSGTTNITGNSGAVLTFSVIASSDFNGGEISLKNILFSDSKGDEYELDDNITKVEVKNVVAEGVTITSPSSTTFKVGETIMLTATVTPADATDRPSHGHPLTPSCYCKQ